ncbi:hypothetical protein Q1695_011969 [Nippostrongylus brasiliensis]|nr:hypothetical protein Q1695_011969 [Nippostrongylus brasiliensis]
MDGDDLCLEPSDDPPKVRLNPAPSKPLLVAADGTVDCGAPTDQVRLYGATPLTFAAAPDGTYEYPPLFEVDDSPIVIGGRNVTLTPDQRQALALGNANFPIVGIQAASGTGKTVVGACIALQQARAGAHVIVTTTTNAAVAQITETILSHIRPHYPEICRFVAETIAFDVTLVRTSVDMQEHLKALLDRLKDDMTEGEWQTCDKYRRARVRLERHTRERDPTTQISLKEREELVLAEKDVSSLVKEVVRIMFRVLSPRIIAITTASLLKATASDGIFRNLLDDFNAMLCDEASQVPELIFAAIISRFPQVRHVYVGDLHQLEPYVQCSRRVNTVHFGARSVMEVLLRARAVPDFARHDVPSPPHA